MLFFKVSTKCEGRGERGRKSSTGRERREKLKEGKKKKEEEEVERRKKGRRKSGQSSFGLKFDDIFSSKKTPSKSCDIFFQEREKKNIRERRKQRK